MSSSGGKRGAAGKKPVVEPRQAPADVPVIAVLGLWHLGCVTAACCAKHFQVVGLDFDKENVAKLNSGKAPIAGAGIG